MASPRAQSHAIASPRAQAVESQPHLWGDSDNATIYGLADRFTGVTPCCTANHNQGWPKLLMNAVAITQDLAVTIR